MKAYLEKMDRRVTSVTALGEEDPRAETMYWLSKTPLERLIALELLRSRMASYDCTQSGPQRVYTVTQLG
jgi:hypothetical protein